MEKKQKTIFITLFIIILFTSILILNYSSILSPLNQPLNNLISGQPDKTCDIDRDCTLRATTCERCDCGDAVSKEWKSFCPFKMPLFMCKPCASIGYDFDIKCIDSQCQKVSKYSAK